VRTLVLRLLLLLGMIALCVPTASSSEVFVSVVFAPPALPVYEQPICPGEGYIWTPGYWAYADDDYYWVPGTWVLAPEVGFLWTPPYWAYVNGAYFFHEGYWGPHVGFYGGVVYGFGYFGRGYEGGRWDHDRFFYNRAVTNVNVTVIHNVYNTRVNETIVSRASFNGPGGVDARASREEEAAARERHIGAPSAQVRHVEEARGNRELRASANAGRPPIAATARPAEFNDRAVVRAKEAGAPYHREENRAAEQPRAGSPNAGNSGARPNTAIHPRDLPPAERPSAPNTGNVKLDQKYQQQQDKLLAKQEQEHQKLQQKQDQEHQRLAQQRANEEKRQQVEQRHQQETAKMEQRHAAQQQKLQHQQQPPPAHNASKPPSGGRPERP
jgi:hypothetical protein